LQNALEKPGFMSVSRIVYLVGAGPGDAGLLTLRGKELLERAEVVIYDGLVSRELLRFAPPSAEVIYGGKHDRTRCVSQAELNALLLAKAMEGKRVVRLKGGDPFVFGRGGEEAEVLAAAGIPFEVVPGVSSVHSVPCYAGIPLTHRHYASSVTIVTGHDAPLSEVGRAVPSAPLEDTRTRTLRTPEPNAGIGADQGIHLSPLSLSLSPCKGERVPFRAGEGASEGSPSSHGSGVLTLGTHPEDHGAVGTPRPTNAVDWARLAKAPGTLVVLMGLRNIQAIATTLIAHGRSPDTPVAIVSRGTTGRQQTVVGTLETIAELASRSGISPPAVTVIGEVVSLREQLGWFEQRPLFGRRVAVTQRLDLARPLVAALRERGADVLEVPATRWVPHPDRARLDKALGDLPSYDWILFTNPLGLEFFFERFFQVHNDLRQLGSARLGAYGPRTGQKLREWRLQPVAVAADHKTPLIIEAITKCGSVQGQRFLVLRGDSAIEKVPEALAELGAVVDVVPCYAVEPETEDLTGDAAALVEEGADWIVFASGLAIEHFHERFDLPGLVARFPDTRLAIASPTVQWALDRLALSPAAVSRPDDAEDLVNTILKAEAAAHEARTTNPHAWPLRETVSFEFTAG
jgi:siroheme synthase/uroporphyrinogen-III synthase